MRSGRAVRRASTAALALSLLVAAACRPPEETRSFNFDPETTQGALGAGWAGFEKTEPGDTFAWAHAREARLTVASRGDGDRLVRFRCWPFNFPGAPPQTLTVYVNGKKADSLTLGGEPRVYTVAVPKDLWKKGANEIRFSFAYAESPKDRVSGSDDDRTLAAAFDWLEVLRPRSAAGK